MLFELRIYTNFNSDEILDLYRSVGWRSYTKDHDLLQRAFSRSLLNVAAYAENKLVGIVRTVGDGESIVFIQDLLVHPEFRRKGIGSALIREVMKQFPHVRQIQLTTDNTPETTSFYRSLGFRTHAELGCVGFISFQQS